MVGCIKTFKVNNSTAGKWLTQLNYTSLTLYRVKISRQIRFFFLNDWCWYPERISRIRKTPDPKSETTSDTASFFYPSMVWWKVESNGLKSFSNSSSALVVLSSIFAANYQCRSMSFRSVFEKTVIWHFQEERQTTALKMQNLVMPVFIYRYTESYFCRK